MGSRSTSTTVNTSQTPVVQDNENPLVITGASNTHLGDSLNLAAGATYSTLDGGAIEKAFDFGSNSVEKVLDLAATAFSNAQLAQGSLLNILGNQTEAAAAADNPEDAAARRNNMLMLGLGGLLIVALIIRRKGGL